MGGVGLIVISDSKWWDGVGWSDVAAVSADVDDTGDVFDVREVH